MKKWLFFLLCACGPYADAQTITGKLAAAMNQWQAGANMRHAIASLYVIDAKTGKVVYAHNEQTGLAPASCQKLFTSVAAFDILGADYRYKTTLGYSGTINNNQLNGDLYITGSCDPTLGSWRYANTKDSIIYKEWLTGIKANNIRSASGRVIVLERGFSAQTIPGGWIWDDIGNYYGAGAGAFNWHENQYDLVLKPGKKAGDKVEIIGIKPGGVESRSFINELKTGPKGSGDNGFIYLPAAGDEALLNGTIPAGVDSFIISGAAVNMATGIETDFGLYLLSSGINTAAPEHFHPNTPFTDTSLKLRVIISTHYSPALDSINYWFLKKSINLYGEALIKTIAYEKTGFGDTENGVGLLKDFWSQHGIESAAIHIWDGSGLSPQNRVTTDALVKALQYAKTRPWFNSFYNALPETNGMKMKSGVINGVRSYAGYQQSKDGKEYIFAIIVNNFDGPPSEITRKMWNVLDVLK